MLKVFTHEHVKLLSNAELGVSICLLAVYCLLQAAAIPLPLVKALFGPYLVFLASTIHGYEGTGTPLFAFSCIAIAFNAKNCPSSSSCPPRHPFLSLSESAAVLSGR